MAKDPSPLLGYNNNIRHKNRVFHVQTEDSGVRHPHIITHLFMDGGRILKSVKTSYAEHLGVEKMADLVRKMMKDQHKGMLIALRDGQFDAVIDGGDAKTASPKPAATAVPASPPSAPRPAEAETLDAIPVPVIEARPPAAPPSAPALAPKPIPPPIVPPAVPERAAAVADLERAAAHVPAPLFEPAPTDLQPPPANLFRPRTGGNYSTVVTPPPPEDTKPPSSVGPGRIGGRPATGRPAPGVKPSTLPPGATVSRTGSARPGSSPASPLRPAAGVGAAPQRPPPIRRGSSPPPPIAQPARRPAPAPVVRPAESRYASARPAAIFGQAKPRSGSSIFGEDIISDKSLDEVIMSYLADDMGTSGAKPDPSKDPKRRK